MKIILTKEVIGTGVPGDVVEVAPGFARNYLFPRNLAVDASDANLKTNNRRREKQNKIETAKKVAAQHLKTKLESGPVVIKVDVGEEGKLYGSVTSREIAEEVLTQLGTEIDKKKILLNRTIKETGKLDVPVKLHAEVTATLRVVVEPKVLPDAKQA
jgi:large subunit ribosomal protein L9